MGLQISSRNRFRQDDIYSPFKHDCYVFDLFIHSRNVYCILKINDRI